MRAAGRPGKISLLLLYSSSAWYFGEGMIAPFFSIFTQHVGGDILDITWVWATYLIVAGGFTIVIGKLSDSRFSKARLVVAGYALNALFTFGYLLVAETWQLFIVQVGLGFASALATPTWNALYAQHHGDLDSGLMWGISDGQEQIVTGVATIIGGLIIARLSYTTLFVLMGCIQTAAAIYLAQILWRPSARPTA
jgi:predicted MFS family arabinose efflux permease